MTTARNGAAQAVAPAPDKRPYHERRLEMPACPACGAPDCYSLVCDEPELNDNRCRLGEEP